MLLYFLILQVAAELERKAMSSLTHEITQIKDVMTQDMSITTNPSCDLQTLMGQ